MEGIDEEIFATVHPHPTLGEWLSETVMAAKVDLLTFKRKYDEEWLLWHVLRL